jgi:hypothetical protein
MGKITTKMNEIKGNLKKFKEHAKKGVFSYREAYPYWKTLKVQAQEFNALVENWIANGAKTKKIMGPQAKLDVINNFTRKWKEFNAKYSEFWDNPKVKRCFG